MKARSIRQRCFMHLYFMHRASLRPFIGSAFMAMLLSSVATPSAQAARVSVSGEDLDLTVPCSGSVHIIVDPSMKDGATLDSNNATQITLRSGKDEAESRISISAHSCAPTGRITISVSPITGISIHDSRDTRFTITGKLASLDASLDSNVLTADNIQSLDLSMRGSSVVHVTTLDRAAQIVAAGNASFLADHANLTAFSAQLSNNATLNITQGTIEALTLVTADTATATLTSTASLATVTANGTGIITLAQVSGPIVRSGSGTVHVGDTAQAPTATASAPPAEAPPPPPPVAAAPAITPAPAAPAPDITTQTIVPAVPVPAPPPALPKALPKAPEHIILPEPQHVSTALPAAPLPPKVQTNPHTAPAAPPAASLSESVSPALPQTPDVMSVPLSQNATITPQAAPQTVAPPPAPPLVPSPAAPPSTPQKSPSTATSPPVAPSASSPSTNTSATASHN